MRFPHHTRRPWSTTPLLAALATAALLLVAPAGAAAQVRPSSTTTTISGTVTVDGEPAPAGTTLVGEVLPEESTTPTTCGQTQVVEDGGFSLRLVSACAPGMPMRLRLLTDPVLEAKDQIEVPRGNVDGALVRFEQPVQDDGTAGIGATLAEAEAERSRPLIGEGGLLVLLGLIAVAAVALLGYVAHHWAMFAGIMSAVPPPADPNREAGSGDARGGHGSASWEQLTVVIPQMMVNGLVLSLAIIAIVVLGASAKLTSEGLVSVLAAIVGYAAGRGAAAAERRP